MSKRNSIYASYWIHWLSTTHQLHRLSLHTILMRFDREIYNLCGFASTLGRPFLLWLVKDLVMKPHFMVVFVRPGGSSYYSIWKILTDFNPVWYFTMKEFFFFSKLYGFTKKVTKKNFHKNASYFFVDINLKQALHPLVRCAWQDGRGGLSS